MNNIFEYSTKKLLQDAVICWRINWINYSDAVLCKTWEGHIRFMPW